MKAAALTCICVSILGAGALFTARSRRRVRALEGFERYFGGLALSARASGGALEGLLTQGAVLEGPGFSFPGALKEALKTAAPAEAWRAAAKECAETRYLLPGETAFLLAFGTAFGESAMETFCERCAVCERKFAALHADAAKKYEKTEKLGVSFAALLAALAFLVLI